MLENITDTSCSFSPTAFLEGTLITSKDSLQGLVKHSVEERVSGLERPASLEGREIKNLSEENSKADFALWEEEGIAPDLYAICKIINKDSTEGLPNSNDRLGWNDWMQKNLLRPNSLDHQDLLNWPKHEKHDLLLKCFSHLGLIEAIKPIGLLFDSIIVFGGTPWDTRERMNLVKDLWDKEGVRANKIVYVNGRRSLRVEEKKVEDVFNVSQKDFKNRIDWIAPKEIPEFQHESAAIVWDQLVEPSDLKDRFEVLTIEPITDPVTGEIRRANTEDTVSAFFNKYPDSKTSLFVSNNPYGPYQGEIVKTVLRQMKNKQKMKVARKVETVASGMLRDCTTVVFTDTLARRFYTQVS
jgi:hypothetical protein